MLKTGGIVPTPGLKVIQAVRLVKPFMQLLAEMERFLTMLIIVELSLVMSTSTVVKCFRRTLV